MKLKLGLLLLFSTLVRCILAMILPLGNDEVYYILYARFPDFHYYDHPLLVGWAIKLFSFNLHFQSPFFYRLPGIIFVIPSTYFVFKTASLIKDEKSGWIAACLFTSSFYASLISGVFILPDSILLFFWTAALYISVMLFFHKYLKEEERLELFMWFGLCVGLGALAKYHMMFLWIGMFGYLIFLKREYILKWQLWVGVFITIILMFPIIYWNSMNSWLSFQFYGNRVGFSNGIQFLGFGKEVVGEILYQNPVVWVVVVIGVLCIKKVNIKLAPVKLLLWMAMPFLFFVWALSFYKETLPHWSGPFFIPLIIISSLYLGNQKNKVVNRFIFSSLALYITSILLACILVFGYPGTIGTKKSSNTYGSGDFTLDMFGWEKSGKEISDFILKNKFTDLPIICPSWFPAAHIDEYVAHNSTSLLFGAGPISKLHQYQWINKKRGGIPDKDSMLNIMPSNYYFDINNTYGKYFRKIEVLTIIPQYRNGALTRNFFIYLLTNPIERIPEPLMYR